MTCVLGLVDGSRMLLAGDSAVGSSSTCAEPKVWRRGNVLVGAAGGCRACNVVEALRFPAYKGGDPYSFVRDEVAEALAGAFKSNQAPHADMQVLIAVGGALVELDDEFGATQVGRDYAAIGSGSGVALGALHALAHLKPRARATRALEASAAHHGYVKPPWTFVTV